MILEPGDEEALAWYAKEDSPESYVPRFVRGETETAHSLRHTAVTQALIAGQTLQEVQQFARHSNINTTLIYAHNLENEKNECSGKLADMFL